MWFSTHLSMVQNQLVYLRQISKRWPSTEYVGTSFGKDAHTVAKALRDGNMSVFNKPKDIKEGASFMDQVNWKEKCLEAQAHENFWAVNNVTIFNLLLQHCTLTLKTQAARTEELPGHHGGAEGHT